MKIWKDEEVKSLFADVEECKKSNLALRNAFLQHAQKFGRKCNSVRNYYYFEVDNLQKDTSRCARLNVNLALHQKAHFQNFDKQKEEELFEKIQSLMSGGLSARAACLQISGGNLQLLTCFQNKYQNMKRKLKISKTQNSIFSQNVQNHAIKIDMFQNGQLQNSQLQNDQFQENQFKNKQLQNDHFQNDQFQENQFQENQFKNKQLQNGQIQNKKIQNLQMSQSVQQNFQIQNGLPESEDFDNIIPFRSIKKALTDADINSLFLGLVRLIKKNAQEEASAEKQSNANALLRKAFLDLNKKEKENTKLKDDFAHLKAENAVLRKKLENNLRKNFANLRQNFEKESEKKAKR